MKTITKEQIDGILAELYRLNVPVVSYDAIQKTLMTLPEAAEEGGNAESK